MAQSELHRARFVGTDRPQEVRASAVPDRVVEVDAIGSVVDFPEEPQRLFSPDPVNVLGAADPATSCRCL